MSASPAKRATVYFDPSLHKALRLKAAETGRSISDVVDEAVRALLAKDENEVATSPFDVDGADLNLAADEIVSAIREGRER